MIRSDCSVRILMNLLSALLIERRKTQPGTPADMQIGVVRIISARQLHVSGAAAPSMRCKWTPSDCEIWTWLWMCMHVLLVLNPLLGVRLSTIWYANWNGIFRWNGLVCYLEIYLSIQILLQTIICVYEDHPIYKWKLKGDTLLFGFNINKAWLVFLGTCCNLPKLQ
jgi:hypothetical protein